MILAGSVLLISHINYRTYSIVLKH